MVFNLGVHPVDKPISHPTGIFANVHGRTSQTIDPSLTNKDAAIPNHTAFHDNVYSRSIQVAMTPYTGQM